MLSYRQCLGFTHGAVEHALWLCCDSMAGSRLQMLLLLLLSQVTHDVSHLTCADFLRTPGTQTPVIVRFR